MIRLNIQSNRNITKYPKGKYLVCYDNYMTKRLYINVKRMQQQLTI